MTALWSPSAGQRPTAAQVATLVPKYARKTVDTSITSSTTLTNDGVLFIPSLSISVEYEFHLHLLTKSNNATNGGLKLDFTLPTGANIDNAIFHSSSPSSFTIPGSSGSVTGITLGTGNLPFTMRGVLVMSTTSGTMQFRWAQNSSHANSAVVSAGSFLRLQPVT